MLRIDLKSLEKPSREVFYRTVMSIIVIVKTNFALHVIIVLMFGLETLLFYITISRDVAGALTR